MLGAATGDIVGALAESSDHTVLTIAVADALLGDKPVARTLAQLVLRRLELYCKRRRWPEIRFARYKRGIPGSGVVRHCGAQLVARVGSHLGSLPRTVAKRLEPKIT